MSAPPAEMAVRVSVFIAVTAKGTSRMFSLRRWAVTMISSTLTACSATSEVWAMAGAAMSRARLLAETTSAVKRGDMGGGSSLKLAEGLGLRRRFCQSREGRFDEAFTTRTRWRKTRRFGSGRRRRRYCAAQCLMRNGGAAPPVFGEISLNAPGATDRDAP
ncbi:hypothetical protein D3C86_1572430 [compost metagenome]